MCQFNLTQTKMICFVNRYLFSFVHINEISTIISGFNILELNLEHQLNKNSFNNNINIPVLPCEEFVHPIKLLWITEELNN